LFVGLRRLLFTVLPRSHISWVFPTGVHLPLGIFWSFAPLPECHFSVCGASFSPLLCGNQFSFSWYFFLMRGAPPTWSHAFEHPLPMLTPTSVRSVGNQKFTFTPSSHRWGSIRGFVHAWTDFFFLSPTRVFQLWTLFLIAIFSPRLAGTLFSSSRCVFFYGCLRASLGKTRVIVSNTTISSEPVFESCAHHLCGLFCLFFGQCISFFLLPVLYFPSRCPCVPRLSAHFFSVLTFKSGGIPLSDSSKQLVPIAPRFPPGTSALLVSPPLFLKAAGLFPPPDTSIGSLCAIHAAFPVFPFKSRSFLVRLDEFRLIANLPHVHFPPFTPLFSPPRHRRPPSPQPLLLPLFFLSERSFFFVWTVPAPFLQPICCSIHPWIAPFAFRSLPRSSSTTRSSSFFSVHGGVFSLRGSSGSSPWCFDVIRSSLFSFDVTFARLLFCESFVSPPTEFYLLMMM